MGTPVRPGMSRVFGRFSFGSFKPATGKKSLMQELMTRLPHWVFIRNTLPDQDTVVNVKQVCRDQRQACSGKPIICRSSLQVRLCQVPACRLLAEWCWQLKLH